MKAIEARGIAGSTANRAEEQLTQRTAPVPRPSSDCSASLKAACWPPHCQDLPVPDSGMPWTIDPALQLARRAEQALAHVSDDDAS